MKLVFCISLFFISQSLFPQRTIKGRVVEAATGEPVSGSSVFVNGTSSGITADKTGYFELNNVPLGRHELIISSIGYETNVFGFSSEQLPLNLKVEMTIKVKELQNVTVEPWVEEGWDKWGGLFTENFIGRTPGALHCKIKNEKAIHFRYFKKSNRVIAYSDEPLIIENRALGYSIRYQLEQFEVDFKKGATTFAGYPFFEEIDKSRKGLQRRWKDAREKAFYGSMMHFMQCLYGNSLEQNGYEIRRMKRIPNTDKERIKSIYRSITAAEGPPKDSIDYYNRIMRQKDYIEIYGNTLLTSDSLIVQTEGEYKSLFFTDYLYVTYKKEMEDKEYLLFPHENRSPVYQRSYIWLVNEIPISVDINGNYYPPQELFSSAYWGWSEKTADLLPSDYKPDE